ncbi:hypothetical protein [Flavobacterium hibisci]|uniref:hypothetical protein n=1 Tax=Flavobacterium hibisci TaxID=1914462 RepID=UPI001CBED831|nr:hypothetical protein [Flavobacterium hibisci]MBZ4044504.1 hypothetical protein [Flavobacterium hibisci]
MNNTGKKYGGRVKGSKNLLTNSSKEIVKSIIEKELDKLPELLANLTPAERVTALIKMLPFVLPKQSELSIEAPIHQLRPISLTLIEEPLKIEGND